MRPDAQPPDHVFVDEHDRPIVDEHLADRYRSHLKEAGIARPQLYRAERATSADSPSRHEGHVRDFVPGERQDRNLGC
jgi:hypothetical protein